MWNACARAYGCRLARLEVREYDPKDKSAADQNPFFHKSSHHCLIIRTNSSRSVASLVGCVLKDPKTARKDRPHSLRIELQTPDSEGRNKYIIAVESHTELVRWRHVIRAVAVDAKAVGCWAHL